MLLNLQMIADSLEELYWEYTLEPGEDRPRFRCCQVYWGQEELLEDFNKGAFIQLFLHKFLDHACDSKTYLGELDQKIHSCYFQNMA